MLQKVRRVFVDAVGTGPDEFILAIAVIYEDRSDVRYIRRPFEKEPDFKATSVNYDLAALLAQAEAPS